MDSIALSGRDGIGNVQVYLPALIDFHGTEVQMDDFGALVSVTANANGATACYANCDGSTAPPVLNTLDFSCFLTKYAAGDPYANCDQSTAPPVINTLDFQCYINQFAAGCD